MTTKSLVRGSAVLLGIFGTVSVGGWLSAGAQSEAGPESAYYVTAGNQGVNWILRRSTSTPFDQVHWFVSGGMVFGEHAIVVDKTVRTLGTNFSAALMASDGAEYTRRGRYTGTDFPYPAELPSTSGILDATTDGQYIYGLDYYNATVWRMDLDWTDPVELFQVLANDEGITYDPSNGGTLWVSSLAQNQTIRQYTLTGEVIASFTIPTGASALARDPRDNTLWFGHGFDGTFYHYSTTGQFLGSITYPELAGTNHLGGEFRFSKAAGGAVQGGDTIP
jgi:hypothetical protein